jgi:hypothetical protein|tara:strand:- start:93 stop:236 length:144 start_codon:yes stop_codon:yes gene_type:complete
MLAVVVDQDTNSLAYQAVQVAMAAGVLEETQEMLMEVVRGLRQLLAQ